MRKQHDTHGILMLLLTFVIIMLQFHWRPHFFINNHNVNANSVEKHCFVVLNVKLQVKVSLVLLTFITVIYCFRLESHWQNGLFCSKCLYNLAIIVKFTYRNWISKTVYKKHFEVSTAVNDWYIFGLFWFELNQLT